LLQQQQWQQQQQQWKHQQEPHQQQQLSFWQILDPILPLGNRSCAARHPLP
jgi:hypothetical protein